MSSAGWLVASGVHQCVLIASSTLWLLRVALLLLLSGLTRTRALQVFRRAYET